MDRGPIMIFLKIIGTNFEQNNLNLILLFRHYSLLITNQSKTLKYVSSTRVVTLKINKVRYLFLIQLSKLK